MTSPISLYVDGTEYSGWKTVRVTRGLLRATSDFDLAVSERWGLEEQAWQILPGAACEVRHGNTVVLTGFVDSYKPSYDGKSHNISLTGRSKTCDFVDSSVLVDGGQFRGLTVGDIARQLAEPYKLTVKVHDDGEPEAEVQVSQGETCFALVERLSRLQALLVTDDADGNLILTRAGTGRASTALRHGSNILAATANLDHSKRFSEVLVKAQRPGNGNKSDDNAETWGDVKPTAAELESRRQTLARLDAIANPGERHRARMLDQRTSGTKKGNPKSLTEVHGSAKDPDIKRYRPLVIVAESQSDDGLAEKRADWEVRRRIAQGTKATVTVNGWKQEDGDLWETNQMVPVKSPWLALERDMIIEEITYSYDDGGEKVQLALTLPDAFLPDKKRKAKKAEKGTGGDGTPSDMWADVKPTGQK